MFDPFYSRSPGLLSVTAGQDAIGCSAARLSYLFRLGKCSPAVAPKAHDHRKCGVSFGPWPSNTMASVRRCSRCSRGGILKHRRTNLPSTTDEGVYNCKIAAKFSGAVNSYSPSAEGA